MEHYFLKGGFSLFTYIGERNWSGSLREVGLWRQDRKIICCCSSVNSCLTLCDPVDCSRPGFPVLHHLPELAQTHVPWVGDAIQPSHPLSPPSPAFNLSQHQLIFQWIDSLHQVTKVLELYSSPSSEHSALISFRIDRFDLLAVQGTLKGLLHHHSSKT